MLLTGAAAPPACERRRGRKGRGEWQNSPTDWKFSHHCIPQSQGERRCRGGGIRNYLFSCSAYAASRDQQDAACRGMRSRVCFDKVFRVCVCVFDFLLFQYSFFCFAFFGIVPITGNKFSSRLHSGPPFFPSARLHRIECENLRTRKVTFVVRATVKKKKEKKKQ